MSYTVTVGGSPIAVYLPDTIIIDDAVNARSSATFTVIGAVAAQLKQNMTVTIDESTLGRKFTGTIDTMTLSRITPNNLYLWKVVCKDGRYKPEKRLYTGTELGGYLAGDAVAVMHQQVLAAEGITANYAMQADDTQSEWGIGTNTNVATPADNTLQIAPAGTPFVLDVGGSLFLGGAPGTFTNTASVGGFLQLKDTAALQMTGTPQLGADKDLVVSFDFWSGSQTVAAGDYLEYDVFHAGTNPEKKGGIDLLDGTGLELRNDVQIFDQNGLDQDPQTDLSAYATDQWYHRKIVMPSSWTGKSIKKAAIVLDGDLAGAYSFYCKNINYRGSTGTLKTAFYTSGALTYGAVHKNVGYPIYAVSTVDTFESQGNWVSSPVTNSACTILRNSFAAWTEVDVPQQSGGAHSYPPQVVCECTYDGGATWVTLTNNAAIPTLVAGAKVGGLVIQVRITLNVGGPSVLASPKLQGFTITLNPSLNTTITSYTDIDQASDGSFATGTLTGVQSTSAGLSLPIITYPTWLTGDMSGMTVYGQGSNPLVTPWFGGVGLTVDDSSEIHAKMVNFGSIKNFYLECDLQLKEVGGNDGFMFRTNVWAVGLNNGAYMIKLSTDGLQFSKGTELAGSWTLIFNYAHTFTTGTWYHLAMSANGTQFTFWIDGTQVMQQTDTTSGGNVAGFIGIRYSNLSGGRTSAYLANIGMCPNQSAMPITGNRVHPALALGGICGSSVIFWNASVPSNCVLLVEASVDGGTTWATCNNGFAIPPLVNGYNMAGKSLLIRETLTSYNANAEPVLTGMHVAVYTQFSATATRISPALPVGAIGLCGSSSMNWDATTPPNTTVTAKTSIDGVSYTTVASGSPVPGLVQQGDVVGDSFDVDTHSNYTVVLL